MNTTGNTHQMYYVAILCPPETDRDVRRFKETLRDQFGCRAALKSPAHITLVAPFWFDEQREERLVDSFRAFRSDMPLLHIELDGFSHFNKRVLFIAVRENAALTELQGQVQEHFRRCYPQEVRPDQRPFHPHVTLATRDLYPAAWEKAWAIFGNKKYEVSFNCGQLCLLKLTGGHWQPLAVAGWAKQSD